MVMLPNIVPPLLEGFLLCASLIVAIGAQNTFVLKQGIKKQHLFLTALTCALFDGALILLGVTGIGALMSDVPGLTQVLCWGGAIFLLGYGLRSFYHAVRPHTLLNELESGATTTKLATFLAIMGFTLLNPHVYIDTFLLLGSVGAEHPAHEHIPFTIGAVMASFAWFFSLTYGTTFLSPLFKNPRAWQILNTIMGFVMIGMAVRLVL